MTDRTTDVATASATTALRVTGTGAVARAAAAHLLAAGCTPVDVTEHHRARPGVLARVRRRGADGRWRTVAHALGDAGCVLVGPLDRDADDAGERTALAAVRVPVEGLAADGALLGALAGAQLARTVLDPVPRAPGGSVPGTCPEYLVTTADLVTRVRPLVALGPLGPGGRPLGPDAWSRAPGPGDVAALGLLAPVWDAVLGVVGEPLPLDLPQVPVGLAAVVDESGRTHGGVGTSTAAARVDAVLAALRRVAGPSASRHALGLGTSPAAARADALGRLAVTQVVWRPAAQAPAPTSGERRFLDVLATLPGGPVRVEHARSRAGFHRVDVRDDAGDLLGRAVATDPGAAAHGALLRAAGRARWRGCGTDLVTPTPELEPLGTPTPAVREQLDARTRSALAAGDLRLHVPEGAAGWAAAGVHAVVASWT